MCHLSKAVNTSAIFNCIADELVINHRIAMRAGKAFLEVFAGLGILQPFAGNTEKIELLPLDLPILERQVDATGIAATYHDANNPVDVLVSQGILGEEMHAELVIDEPVHLVCTAHDERGGLSFKAARLPSN